MVLIINKEYDANKAILKTSKILKRILKKGDIILTKPRLSNIKLLVMYPFSFIISKLSQGVTHSCLYLGKGYVLEIGTAVMDTKIKKLKLENLIRNKIKLFNGVTIYVVQPKHYKHKHRKLVLKIAINKFLKKSKDLVFSYKEMLKLWFNLVFKKYSLYKKEKLNFKKEWHCSNLIAYILKKASVPIGKRPSTMFIPSTFLFSKYFKLKKKIILK